MDMKLTPREELAYKQYVHNPTQAFNALVKLARKMYQSTGISSGSKQLDHYMIPTRGPWVRLWVAAPGQGKSTFLRIIAFNTAQDLVARGLQDKYYVAHISYEEAIDSQEIKYLRSQGFREEDFWRGKVDPAIIMRAGMTRPDLPIYWLGESMDRSTPDSPIMTVSRCIDGMRAIWKMEGKLPYVIVFDYVQQAEVEKGGGGTRTEKVIAAMKQIIRMGTVTGCAIELGAQARRSSMQNNPPLPNPDDIEWAHFIYELATNAVGLWRPWTTHSKDSSALINGITVNQEQFPLSPHLTVVNSLKHRPGQLGPSIPMEVNPTTLEITDFNTIGQVNSP